MKAICGSVNFDLFMVLPRPAARITHPLNWNFPAMIGPETGKQVNKRQGANFVEYTGSRDARSFVGARNSPAHRGQGMLHHLRAATDLGYQRFFRRYLHLCGMTGTAIETSGELQAYTIYGSCGY